MKEESAAIIKDDGTISFNFNVGEDVLRKIKGNKSLLKSIIQDCSETVMHGMKKAIEDKIEHM